MASPRTSGDLSLCLAAENVLTWHSRFIGDMNLRAGSVGDDVEDLRRQIETALGGVEEIVKNNGVISVATSAEDAPRAVKTSDDEVVVYVSIKINKGDPARLTSNNYHDPSLGHSMMGNHVDFQNQQHQLPNGNIKKVAMMPGPDHEVNGLGHGGDQHQEGHKGGGHPVVNGGVGAKGLKDAMTKTEVTGQAIRPKRRGKMTGLSRSLTAPTTPVRGVSGVGHLLRSKSVEQNSQEHSKSLEVKFIFYYHYHQSLQ